MKVPKSNYAWIIVAVSLGCCYCAACDFAAGAAWADEAPTFEPPLVWRVKPYIDKMPSLRDREAREQLLKTIERKQTREFRELARVSVPEHSSGLPADYEFTIIGRYSDSANSASRLAIRVTDSKATAELLNYQGIARGELPFRDVDTLARQIVYSFQSRIEPRDPDGFLPVGGRGASHLPRYTLRLLAEGEAPIHLQTEPEQALHDVIDFASDGLRGYIHTLACNRLLDQARDELPMLPREQQRAVVVEELDKTLRGKAVISPGDETAVEAILYSHLAVELAAAEALPALERANATLAATKLKIATAANPCPMLAAAITGDDHGLAQWCLRFAAKSDSPEVVQMLVELVQKLQVEREGAVMPVLARLRGRKLTHEQLSDVNDVFEDLHAALNKARVGEFLLIQTGDDRYYDFLMTLARNKSDVASSEAIRAAQNAVLGFSAHTKQRRDESYALLRELLKGMPADPKPDSFRYFELIEHWGGLATRDDLPELEMLAENDSGYVASYAIEAIGRIAPPIAVRKARERVEAFVRRGEVDDSGFSWNVAGYYELILWQDDRASIEPLKRAAKLLSEEERESWRGSSDPQPLINYLQADDPAQRVGAALAFVKRRTIDPAWLNDVAQELLAAGADAEQCRRLMVAARRK